MSRTQSGRRQNGENELNEIFQSFDVVFETITLKRREAIDFWQGFRCFDFILLMSANFRKRSILRCRSTEPFISLYMEKSQPDLARQIVTRHSQGELVAENW